MMGCSDDIPATLPAPMILTPSLSAKAQERLRKPRTRGAFQPVDAARRQLGLLAVSDAQGQGRLFWLVDLTTQVIEDARFLAFGSLASHPLLDALTELVRGRTVADACRLTFEQVDSLLRNDPLTPSCDPADGEFLADLLTRAEAALPEVKLLPKPVEKIVYQRKRQADWTPADQTWLPLSLLKKIGKVDGIVRRALADLGSSAEASVEGLHDDFRIVIKFTGIAPEQVPTLVTKLTESVHSLHPQLSVEALP